jgi:hypothetical protein
MDPLFSLYYLFAAPYQWERREGGKISKVFFLSPSCQPIDKGSFPLLKVGWLPFQASQACFGGVDLPVLFRCGWLLRQMDRTRCCCKSMG